MLKRACEICGKKFKVKPNVVKRGGGRFCSRSCKNKAQNTQIQLICEICGNRFYVKKGRANRAKYCSTKCRDIGNSGDKHYCWNSEKRTCRYCGATFYARQSYIFNGGGLFCSTECYHNAFSKEQSPLWRGGLIERNCEECNNPFFARSDAIKKGNGRFCSRSCARRAQKMPTQHTKPENVFKKIIKNNNLSFKYVGDNSFWIGHKPALNPDFIHINKKKKIVIEIFGAYWHNNMLLNSDITYVRTYNGRIKIFKERGWKCIIFWDHDLMREDAEAFVLNELAKHKILT